MAEELTEVKEAEEDRVNVFTHSSTEFPGAWSEEEIGVLLDVWERVVERMRKRPERGGRARRQYVTHQVLRRLSRRKGFRGGEGERGVDRDSVRAQMNTLRTEYVTYQGLCKIKGLCPVRATCVDQLDRIFSPFPDRQRTESGQGDAVSEDSDQSQRLSTSYEDKAVPADLSPNLEEANDKKLTFQKRMSFKRMGSILINQLTMLESIQNLFQSLEMSSSKIINLMEEMVTLQKSSQKEVCQDI